MAESQAPQAPTRLVAITPRTIWLAAGIAAGFLLVAFVLTRALGAFILLFVGIILAEGIRPLVRRLGQWRIPRPIAIILIYLAVFAGLLLLGWLLVNPLTSQLVAFVNSVPDQIGRLQQEVQRIQQQAGSNSLVGQVLNALGQQAGNIAGQIAPIVLNVPLGILSLIFNAILVLVIAFMWLTAVDGLKPFVIGLLPVQVRDEAADILREMGERIGGYLRAVVFNSLVIGAISTVGLALLGVPYPLVLGTFAGLTEAIPMIGPWISGGVAALVALVTVGPLKAAEVILIFVVIQQVEGNTLVPLVMNRAVKLNPLVVLMGLLVGTGLFGLIGGVLSVPLTVVLEVVVTRILAPLARHASARASRPLPAPEVALGGERPAPEEEEEQEQAPEPPKKWRGARPAAT